MAAETGFLIDGTVYEVPALTSLSLDEAEVLYDYADLTLDEILAKEYGSEAAEDEDWAVRWRNPHFRKALVHIAYQRGNPDMKRQTVAEVIGAANILSVLSGLQNVAVEEEALPLVSTSEPPESSLNGSLENAPNESTPTETPGDASPSALAPLAVPPTPIGATRSGTSSTLAQTSSGA